MLHCNPIIVTVESDNHLSMLVDLKLVTSLVVTVHAFDTSTVAVLLRCRFSVARKTKEKFQPAECRTENTQQKIQLQLILDNLLDNHTHILHTYMYTHTQTYISISRLTLTIDHDRL